MCPARAKVLLQLEIGLGNPCGDSAPSLIRQLELHRPLRLILDGHCPGLDLTSMDDVANAEIYQIAATQLTVNGEIKQR